MTLPTDNEQHEIEQEADNIATIITNILINAFKLKEGRDPTNEEVEMLFDELTEQRIAEMLGEVLPTPENISSGAPLQSNDNEIDGDEEEDDEDDDDSNNNDNDDDEHNSLSVEPTSMPIIPESANKFVFTFAAPVISKENLNTNTSISDDAESESCSKRRKIENGDDTLSDDKGVFVDSNVATDVTENKV